MRALLSAAVLCLLALVAPTAAPAHNEDVGVGEPEGIYFSWGNSDEGVVLEGWVCRDGECNAMGPGW